MSGASLDGELLLAAVNALPEDELAAARRQAASQLAARGFPHVGQEDWKYTSLAGPTEISNEWLGLVAAGRLPGVDLPAALDWTSLESEIDAHWLVLRNGVASSDLAELAAATGLDIEPVTAADLVNPGADPVMSLFNVALLRGGLRISIPAQHRLGKPLAVLCLDNPTSAVTQSRLFFEADKESSAEIVEINLSDLPGRQFTNSVVQLQIAEGASIDYVRIQNRDAAHAGVSRFESRLQPGASLSHNSFDLGGALTRNDTIADIRGAGASVDLNGLYLASGDQHIDNHTAILHGVGPAASNEEYRGILAGRSRCIFNGKVVVAEGADGTDSSQTNHNLLLSDRAEIDTKPELEIYADDVKCAHGATVGQLDESALFYLRSRGFDVKQARQLLTRAFAAELLSRLPVDAAREYLGAVLDNCLEALTEEQE